MVRQQGRPGGPDDSVPEQTEPLDEDLTPRAQWSGLPPWGDADRLTARRLLPAAILLPAALAVLRLAGDRAGWSSTPLRMTIQAVVEILVLLGFTLVAARHIRRLDAERTRLVAEEREARVNEARAKNVLDAVIDQMPVGIMVASVPSGEVIRRNRVTDEFIASLARAAAENGTTTPRTWYRTDGTPYDPADYPINRAATRGEVIEQEEMISYGSGGAPIHVTVNAAPVRAVGTPVMAVATFVDISTRRAAERALADRDATLRSFFAAPEVMLTVVEADVSAEARAAKEANYRFVIANAAMAAVFGVTETEMAGRTASELGVDSDRRRSFLNALAESHRLGKPVTVERTSPVPRGAPRTWLSVVISPLRGPTERLPRFCIVATDVSRRMHLEEELLQSQKLEAVGRLAGGIAHDFNNLLTAITGFTRFALADLPPGASSVRDDLEQAMRAAERAGALTHQLLAFSRQQVLQPQVLDLNQVVSGIEPMLRRVIGEDIEIDRVLGTSLGAVRADRGQLEQVLVNLVVNARDAMPNGGLLTVETANVDLDAAQLSADRSGGSPGPHVMLAVTDTGVGMSAETRERIFEPFFTTKETGRGTGLGLATVFGIVRQSGGHVSVSSEPGHGTTFRIYLPRYDGLAESPRSVTPVSAPVAVGRVLLVEDDKAVRTIATRVLGGAGYEVVEATTGREGLEKFRSLNGQVDLIVTDLVLPELGGRAMIEELAKQAPIPPVVYMSGYTSEAISAQSVLDPEDQFLEKPFTPDSLLAKVRDALQGPSAREPRRVG